MTSRIIRKILSPNDVGSTGGHQAGILIPKDQRILSFFPSLDTRQLNPRAHVVFEDETGKCWEFAFIYYNNRLFGGTRNEYRLTRMTRYLREAGLQSADEVILSHDENGRYFISHQSGSTSVPISSNKSILKLSGGWRVIDISK